MMLNPDNPNAASPGTPPQVAKLGLALVYPPKQPHE
jgi:hypothetical protein